MHFFSIWQHKPFLPLLCGLTMGIRHQRYSSGSCPSTAGHSAHPGHRSYTHVCWSWATKTKEEKQRWGQGLSTGLGMWANQSLWPSLLILPRNLRISLPSTTVLSLLMGVILLSWSPESQGILTEGSAEKTDTPEKPDFAPSWLRKRVWNSWRLLPHPCTADMQQRSQEGWASSRPQWGGLSRSLPISFSKSSAGASLGVQSQGNGLTAWGEHSSVTCMKSCLALGTTEVPYHEAHKMSQGLLKMSGKTVIMCH